VTEAERQAKDALYRKGWVEASAEEAARDLSSDGLLCTKAERELVEAAVANSPQWGSWSSDSWDKVFCANAAVRAEREPKERSLEERALEACKKLASQALFQSTRGYNDCLSVGREGLEKVKSP